MTKNSNGRINLKIKYSAESESERVFNVVQRIGWYKSNGYKISLPKSLKSFKDTPDRKNINKTVALEYKKGEYQRAEARIEKKWFKISEELYREFNRAGFMPENTYFVILTKYGTGGSYNLPNKIILNFKNKETDGIISIIIHEIIHLLIEPLIKKYQIKHWYKERIVDLMLAKISPSNSRMQKIPVNTEKIDKSFNKFFPDVDKILKNIKK